MLQDTSRIPISIGFVSVLLLILALVSVSLSQFQNINESLSSLVKETHIKLQAANSMRDAIRLRADSLKKMRLLDDPFERDEEYMNFINYARDFRIAREKLLQLPMNSEEVNILERLTKTLKIAQPVNEQAAQQLFDALQDESFLTHIEEAESLQYNLLNLLDSLVVIENQSAQAALVRANGYYENTRYILFGLATAVFIMVIAIGIIVIRLVGVKSQQISYQAMHDPLTNLYNRCYFEHQIEKAIETVGKNDSQYVLLYLDLDQFKVVNDTCGHMAGDHLLRQLTILLKGKIRKSDVLARLGGDEFGLLLKDCDVVKASLLGEEIKNLINEFRFIWDEKVFTVGVSIGVAPIDNQVCELKDVLIAADSACYAAKDAGRNQVHIYDPGDKDILGQENQIHWMSEIATALDENRLLLYAQAMDVVSQDSETCPPCYEILVRLQDRDGRLYPPGAFLPAAERYGQITEIDRWVIKQTFDFISSKKNLTRDTTFFINISGRSLADSEFHEYLKQLFKKYNIPAAQICFEFREADALATFDIIQDFIHTFRSIGCQFSVDDFGSGLTSFAYLKQMSVNYIKVDGLFVQNIADDPVNYTMVKSINELAHLYGKKTVAKFVESKAIRDKVTDLGIDFVQGYEITVPVKLAEITP